MKAMEAASHIANVVTGLCAAVILVIIIRLAIAAAIFAEMMGGGTSL